MRHPPKIALPRMVNSLKGVSARYLRQEYTGTANRAITHGRPRALSYFAASCGSAPLAVVTQYIKNKKRPA